MFSLKIALSITFLCVRVRCNLWPRTIPDDTFMYEMMTK